MVNAQIPWELADTTSINAYVRSENPDEAPVMVTTPVAVTMVTASPGIYARPGTVPSVGTSSITHRAAPPASCPWMAPRPQATSPP